MAKNKEMFVLLRTLRPSSGYNAIETFAFYAGLEAGINRTNFLAALSQAKDFRTSLGGQRLSSPHESPCQFGDDGAADTRWTMEVIQTG